MGRPAAAEGDKVTATDQHLILPPAPGATPVLVPHPFAGSLDGDLSGNVRIEGRWAATVDSTATNLPVHTPSGGTFVRPPANKGTVAAGSSGVRINGKKAARGGDAVRTCNDPADQPVGKITAAATSVRIGDRRPGP